MKRIAIIMLLAVSCVNKEEKKKIEVNYECPGYFTKDDWQVLSKGDTVLSYLIDRNIMLNKKFPSATDSVNIVMELDEEQFKKLPSELNLSSMIYKALLRAKSNCNYSGTFRPTRLAIHYIHDRNMWMMLLDFYASNAYGTAGELHGLFEFDSKTYQMIDEGFYKN